MRFKMRHNLKKNYSVILIFLTILLSFQNCAEPLQIEDQSYGSKSDTYPFAFETKVDTFAYMSCAGFETTTFNNKAIFSFKSGAYRSGSGIGLNTSFIESIGNMRMTQQEQVLSQGAANKGAQVQTAMRRRSNLLEYYVADTSGQGTEGVDFDNVLNPLDSEDLLRPIIAGKGSRIGYFSNLPGLENRRIESHLYFNGSEELARDLRSRLHNGELIYSMGYVDVGGTHPVVPMSPGESASGGAYGLGLRMIFAKGHGLDGFGNIRPYTSTSDARTLQSLREVDLLKPGIEKTQAEANWICPENLRFMIVRPQDNGDVLCGATSAAGINFGYYEDPMNPTNVSLEEYQAVRSILPVEYWHVDFKKRCVVNKESDDKCYDVSQTKQINYFNGSNSFPATCGSGEDETYQCPHYVSICYLK